MFVKYTLLNYIKMEKISRFFDIQPITCHYDDVGRVDIVKLTEIKGS